MVEFTLTKPFTVLYDYFNNIFHGDFGSYNFSPRWGSLYYPVFPDIFKYYSNSMLLLLGSVILGIVIGLIISILLLYVRRSKRKAVILLNYFFMSFPDFIIFLLLQAFIIWFYLKTGHKLARFMSLADRPAILLPMLSIAIPPLIYTIRVSIDSFHEVYSKQYILIAYAKGLNKLEIIHNHIIKNALPSIFTHFPKLLQMSISNLFLVEIIYNIRGLMSFMVLGHIHIVFPSLTLIWITYFILSSIIESYTKRSEVITGE